MGDTGHLTWGLQSDPAWGCCEACSRGDDTCEVHVHACSTSRKLCSETQIKTKPTTSQQYCELTLFPHDTALSSPTHPRGAHHSTHPETISQPLCPCSREPALHHLQSLQLRLPWRVLLAPSALPECLGNPTATRLVTGVQCVCPNTCFWVFLVTQSESSPPWGQGQGSKYCYRIPSV